MEHNNLTRDYDENLINKILDNIDMRYIVLFLYVIRNDLFNDLNDPDIINAYEKILILDDIYKDNLSIWDEEFTEIVVDLGLFKNIRSIREFKQKDDDFILRMGEETITIEQNTILTPADTLFLTIQKKFKFLTKRNFNLALTRLKGVSCERTSVIHPFIFEIGEHDYALSDDLYYILDQFGNIYQAIKMEITIEGFYDRFKKIQDKIVEFIEIFDSFLNSKTTIRKINKAIDEKKDIIKHLKDEKVKLPDKFELDDLDKDAPIFKEWINKLLELLNFRFQIDKLNEKITEIKKYYSGKGKKNSYLEFIEKVSFNEDNIVDDIQESLIDIRKDVIVINEKISELTTKEIKLLNLDYERFVITSGDE